MRGEAASHAWGGAATPPARQIAVTYVYFRGPLRAVLEELVGNVSGSGSGPDNGTVCWCGREFNTSDAAAPLVDGLDKPAKRGVVSGTLLFPVLCLAHFWFSGRAGSRNTPSRVDTTKPFL